MAIDFSNLKDRITEATEKRIFLKDLVEDLLREPKEFSWITDEFSALRYISYINDQTRSTPDFSGTSTNPFISSYVTEFSAESGAAVNMRHKGSEIQILSHLYGVSMKGQSLSPEEFSGFISGNDYKNTVLKDILFDGKLKEPAEFQELLKRRLPTAHSSELKLLLELAARLKTYIPQGQLADLMECKADSEIAIATVDYAGALGRTDCLGFLERYLGSWQCHGPAFLVALVDVLGQIGDERTADSLRTFDKTFHLSGTEELLHYLTELSIKEIYGDLLPVTEDREKGLSVAQFMFYGDPEDSGKAGSGGLGTLLTALGERIPAVDSSIEGVFTFVLVPINEFGDRKPVVASSTGHTVIRLPIFEKSEYDETVFLRGEDRIKRGMARAMYRYRIAPDIFHVRYSDNASKVITELATELNKKLVFTVTPDPHRRFCDASGRPVSPDTFSSAKMLNSVYIADKIIDRTQNLLGIGTDENLDQLIPYFPRFKDPDSGKRITMIPEGINLNVQCEGPRNQSLIELLYRHSGVHALERSGAGKPLIVTVGRLHPLKGQLELLKAWGESRLNGLYNLVFVGGDFTNPEETERKILNEIRDYLLSRPDLEGRFCHIPAMKNPEVRCFEKLVAEELALEYPNIYISPSYKEEFGIAILEAMATGFLAFGPGRGGVKGYIDHGKNGFLIDTSSSETISSGMESVLFSEAYPPIVLREISLRGKGLVKRRFEIGNIAGSFGLYYSGI